MDYDYDYEHDHEHDHDHEQRATSDEHEEVGDITMHLYQVDAFTNRPFGGNPAAICLLEREREDAWMQAVAAEMNLSETAFLRRQPDGYDLRWFTPASEVDLCGHATLASAHILWEQSLLDRSETARFHTKSGLLLATTEHGWVQLDFPATPAREVIAPEELLSALGIGKPVFAGRSLFDYLVEVEDEETVRRLRPEQEALLRVSTRGVIVTARGRECDFVSRFFAPEVGVYEDPVTGSAHCCLGPYWQAKLGKDDLLAHQVSARGGVLRIKPRGERVLILGQAITVLAGELMA